MLTPENIQNQQFHVRFRGFDVDEVDTFLEKVAENYLLIQQENTRMTAELEQLQNQQAANQSQEDTFKTAIISAQTIADEMKKKSAIEAEACLTSAREQATAIVDEATNKVSALEEQISTLQGEKDRIKEELRLFLRAQIDDLDNDSQTVTTLNPMAHSEPAEKKKQPEENNAAEVQPEEIPEFEAQEDDLSDLYEKIELPEDMADELPLADDPQQLFTSEPGETSPPLEKLNDFTNETLIDDVFPTEESPTIPNFDDDMLFTLEDPLDEEPGPAVIIEPLEEKDERR